MDGYKGGPKRWLEGFYGGSHDPGEDAVEVRSAFFRRFLGRDALRVPPVGHRLVDGVLVARPLLVATDLQVGMLDAQGQQVPGGSDGFYDTDPAREETLAPLLMLLERARRDQLVTLLPGDQHENQALFDREALTTTVLDPDLGLLSARERAVVEARFGAWIGKRLPLGVWEAIFMDPADPVSRGQAIGREARNFLPHCTEGVVRYLPDVEAWLAAEREAVLAQAAAGDLVPRAHVFPVPKDGLTVEHPEDARGLGGNKFDAVLNAAFTGPYFQGDDHRRDKRAIVVGCLSEYSVRLAIEHLIDADVTVIWLLTATKGLDLFSAKLADAHFLRERYGKKLVVTYDWPVELLGPVPPGWDAARARVVAHDRAAMEAHLARLEAQLRAGVTGQGAPLVMEGAPLLQALGLAGKAAVACP